MSHLSRLAVLVSLCGVLSACYDAASSGPSAPNAGATTDAVVALVFFPGVPVGVPTSPLKLHRA
jgi:hypothetical protein